MSGRGADDSEPRDRCFRARRRCSSQSARLPGSAPAEGERFVEVRAGPWLQPGVMVEAVEGPRGAGRGRAQATSAKREARKAAANRTSPKDRIRGEASIQSPSQEALRKTRPIVIGTHRSGPGALPPEGPAGPPDEAR